MECTPAASAEVLNVATPPDKVPVPRIVVSSINVTVPVAVPVAVDETTVAVKVTELPKVDGLESDEILVVVAALFTVCERTVDVDPE